MTLFGLEPLSQGALGTTFILFTSIYISSVAGLDAIGFMGITFSLVITLWFAFCLLTIFWDTFLGPALGRGVDFQKLGRWAVVTGATDGIGLAYAKQLANLGINIVLISRNKERLETAAMQIETEFTVKTKIIQVDFSLHSETYEKLLESELTGLEIGTVVNNVGMTYERPSYFDEVACNNPTFATSMINLNVVAVTTMTRLLLLPMLQRGNSGVFINVGSVASLYGLPFFSLYSATKSFMETLTLDLALEYESKGIIFQYQSPGYVDTKIAKQGGSTLFIPSPDQYARAGLRSVGLQQKTFVWLPQRFFACAGILLEIVGGKEFVRRTFYSVVFTVLLFVKKRQMDKEKKNYSIV